MTELYMANATPPLHLLWSLCSSILCVEHCAIDWNCFLFVSSDKLGQWLLCVANGACGCVIFVSNLIYLICNVDNNDNMLVL